MYRNKKRNDMEEVFASEDRGVSKIVSMTGSLSKLFRLALFDNNLNLIAFNKLLNDYVIGPRSGIPNNKRDQTSARGNLIKEIFKPRMSWKVFCKALQILQVIKLDFSIITYHYDGRQRVHTVSVKLRDYKSNPTPVNDDDSDDE